MYTLFNPKVISNERYATCPYCKELVSLRLSWIYTKKHKRAIEKQYHFDCLKVMLTPEEWKERMTKND